MISPEMQSAPGAPTNKAPEKTEGAEEPPSLADVLFNGNRKKVDNMMSKSEHHLRPNFRRSHSSKLVIARGVMPRPKDRRTSSNPLGLASEHGEFKLRKRRSKAARITSNSERKPGTKEATETVSPGITSKEESNSSDGNRTSHRPRTSKRLGRSNTVNLAWRRHSSASEESHRIPPSQVERSASQGSVPVQSKSESDGRLPGNSLRAQKDVRERRRGRRVDSSTKPDFARKSSTGATQDTIGVGTERKRSLPSSPKGGKKNLPKSERCSTPTGERKNTPTIDQERKAPRSNEHRSSPATERRVTRSSRNSNGERNQKAKQSRDRSRKVRRTNLPQNTPLVQGQDIPFETNDGDNAPTQKKKSHIASPLQTKTTLENVEISSKLLSSHQIPLEKKLNNPQHFGTNSTFHNDGDKDPNESSAFDVRSPTNKRGLFNQIRTPTTPTQFPMSQGEQLAQNARLVKSETQKPNDGKISRLNMLLSATKFKSFKKLPDDVGSLMSNDFGGPGTQGDTTRAPKKSDLKSTVFDPSEKLSDSGRLSFSMDLATTELSERSKISSYVHQGSEENLSFKMTQTTYFGKIGEQVRAGFPTMHENSTISKLPSFGKNLFERPQRPRPMFRRAISERNFGQLDEQSKPFDAASEVGAQFGLTRESTEDATSGGPIMEKPKRGRHHTIGNFTSSKFVDSAGRIHFRSSEHNLVSNEILPASQVEKNWKLVEKSLKTDGQLNTAITKSVPEKIDQDEDGITSSEKENKGATNEASDKKSPVVSPNEVEPLSDELKDSLDLQSNNDFSDGLRNLEVLLQKNSVVRSSVPDPSVCLESIVSEEDYVGKLERLLSNSKNTRTSGLPEPSIGGKEMKTIHEANGRLGTLLLQHMTDQVSQLAEPSICDSRPYRKEIPVTSSIQGIEGQSERLPRKTSDEDIITDFIRDQPSIDEIGVIWAATDKFNDSTCDEAQEQDNQFLQLTLPGMIGYQSTDPNSVTLVSGENQGAMK